MSSLRHALALALVSAVVFLGGAPACSQQTEGERCDNAKAGDADCEAGLTCVVANNLVERTADRCCPPPGEETDKRCTRGTPGSSSSGGTSSSGTSGEAGAAPAAEAGAGGAGGAGD